MFNSRFKHVFLAVILLCGTSETAVAQAPQPGQAPPQVPQPGQFGSQQPGTIIVPGALLGVFQNTLNAHRAQLQAELNLAQSTLALLQTVEQYLPNANEQEKQMIAEAVRGIFEAFSRHGGILTTAAPAAVVVDERRDAVMIPIPGDDSTLVSGK